ncbi:2OG-Fe(II) oxygenase family protein [Mesorhizobium sp. M0195]|uniref:2OG-Fe(II) oxygenase family protein n=1 Tax=unclassified Mesorhizobium TaxID=325217 RepID=UPI003335C0E5
MDSIPGTLVVNIGAVLELASNGYLRATVHRVETPPPASRGFRSVFLKRGGNATTSILSLPQELAAEARGPASGRGTVVPTCRLKSRLRSYVDVARRYYADVQVCGRSTNLCRFALSLECHSSPKP